MCDKQSSIFISKGHLVVRVYFRPSGQGVPVDKILLQLQEASHWKPLILDGLIVCDKTRANDFEQEIF